jgi:two-component system KDP operon response regulator KdpE
VGDKARSPIAPTNRRADQPSPILVVDDDAFIRRIIRDALEGEGFVVATSATATDALAAASRLHPRVAILDVNLPDMRGEVVARALDRRLDGQVQIITISGDDGAAKSASDMHAVACLRKPFDIDDLVKIVEDLAPADRGLGPLR